MNARSRLMTVLQAAAILTLWRSGRFDTHDISIVIGRGMSEADVFNFLATVREREHCADLRVVGVQLP